MRPGRRSVPTHPQYALKGLLERIGVTRSEVAPWPGGEAAGTAATRARARLIADAMRPAETITAWRALPPPAPDSLRDIHRIDCASPQEEAGVIAIVMRRALEIPGPHCRAGDGGPRPGPPGRGRAQALEHRRGRFSRVSRWGRRRPAPFCGLRHA